MNRVMVKITAITHRGSIREQNEDCIVAGPWVRQRNMQKPETLFVEVENAFIAAVADGMGGHQSGEVASKTAAYWLCDNKPGVVNEENIGSTLKEINAALYSRMETETELRAMGTTIAGLAVSDNQVVIFNVGDSRVYKVTDGYLMQLSTDDTPERIMGVDQVLPEQGLKRSSVITQSLGGMPVYTDIDPHIILESLTNGDNYLICSDGLTDMVELEQIESCLQKDSIATVKQLFDKAIEGGGGDNISIILVEMNCPDIDNDESRT